MTEYSYTVTRTGAGSWDVSSAVLNDSQTISANTVSAYGPYFRSDGEKAYFAEQGASQIDEYDLSTPWDVTSLAYLRTKSTTAASSSPRGVFFKPDGLKMYTAQDGGNEISEWDLSPAWDVTSATLNDSFDVSAKTTTTFGVFISSDGKKVYIGASSTKNVHRYDLGIAWDIMSAVFNQTFSATATTNVSGIHFNASGTQMLIPDHSANKIHEYELTTEWDMSTATKTGDFDVNTQETGVTGVFMKPDGKKMYIGGFGSGKIHEYDTTLTGIGTTDISSDVETITINERGTGQISSATIRMESDRGEYFTSAPQFDEYDLIRIQITDDDSNTFDKLYEVSNLTPIENVQEGSVLDVEMLGLEHHLQKAYFAKQFYFENAYNVVKDIIDIYNDNKATSQPEIVGHDSETLTIGATTYNTNLLSKATANLYDFNVAEKQIYNGCVDVVNRLGSTVADGGANDFWELYFRKHDTDNTKLILQAEISGSNPGAGSEITISDADSVNEDPSEGGIDSTFGTIAATWGADNGSQPVDTAQFAGELEAFLLHNHWVAITGGYPQNAFVQYNGVHYQSDIDDNTSTPGVANWTVKTIGDILGNSEYSPWTNDKASQFQNSGSNPVPTSWGAATGFNQKGFYDGNLVVWDNNHYRSQVELRVKDITGIDVNYLYGQASGGVYRGFRVLIDPNIGAIGAPFNENSGNDRFGKAYSNNIVQHNGGTAGTYLDWDVFRETADDEEVSVVGEGKVYERQTGTWTDISGTGRANDPFHIYTSVVTDAGVNKTVKSTGPTVTYGDTSAIEVTYDYTTFGALSSLILNTEEYYKIGAWLNIRFPYPFSTHNSVSTMGELWGNNATKKEPVTFDTDNMHLSHSGNTGFNHSEASEYGVVSAINFAMRLNWLDGLGAPMLEGNFKMRCLMYDTSDNVVFQDFVIKHNNLFEDITLPISNFQTYRARIPYRYEVNSIAAAFLLDDLDIVNRFEFKNIKQIVFQTQESYDDQGRYRPELSRYYLNTVFTGAGKISLAIDRFHFVKPLLAVSDPITTGRALMPKFRQAPLISNQKQLVQSNNTWLQVTKFRHKEYNIKRQGKLDINLFDTFFLNKSDMVADDDTRTADSGGTANNIRLVAKEITYKISKSSSESGDFVQYIKGIKRILS